MKKYLFFTIFFLVQVFSQELHPDKKKMNGYLGVGSMNLFYFGLDYHFDNKFSAGIKYNILVAPATKSLAFFSWDGFGLKTSYKLNKAIMPNGVFMINTISAEISTTIRDERRPYYLQFGIGKEKAKSFYWNLGVGFVTQDFERNWIIPYLKFGIYI